MKHKKHNDKEKEEEKKHLRSNTRLLTVVIPVMAAVALGIGIAFYFYPFSTAPADQGGNDNNDDGATGNDVSSDESLMDEGPRAHEPGTILKSVDLTQANIIGDPTDIGFNVGMVSTLLQDSNEKVSFKFTAKYSGSVNIVVVNLLTTGNFSSSIRAGLQGDDGSGKPSGQWIGQPGLGNGQVDDRGFTEVTLEEQASLTKGNTYHLVIEPVFSSSNDPSSVTNTDGVRVRMYQFNNPVQPLNDENLDRLWPDVAINTLYYDGKDWAERNNWPIFVVKYSDGRSQGVPYSLSAPWIIYGKRYVGQEIIPSSNYSIEKFGFSVSFSGKPADKLYYQVRDSQNNILAKGLFVEASQLTPPRKFVEVTLDKPLTLNKDELYRFVLLSPGSQSSAPFQLYGHEFTYDNKIGYGGVRNILTITYDAGSSWIRWEDADTIFELVVTP